MTRFRPTPKQWVYAALASLLIVSIGFYFLTRDATETADTRTQERNAAVGAAEDVIDCINDPTTQSTEECQAEAQDAQETLQANVPPMGLTARQRREVVLITAELIAADPEISEADVVNEVLDRLPAPESGDRGRRGPVGPAGQDAVPPSTAEVRALVQAVYAANPPAPGADGVDGADGADGKTGPRGPSCVEDLGLDACRGPAGGDGTDGRDGATGPQGPEGPTGPVGPEGPVGPAGVVDVATSAECALLVPGMSVSLSYDAVTQTVTLVCA